MSEARQKNSAKKAPLSILRISEEELISESGEELNIDLELTESKNSMGRREMFYHPNYVINSPYDHLKSCG